MFEYTPPKIIELREDYITPYRFKDDLLEIINQTYLHPHNKNNRVYSKYQSKWTTNDMASIGWIYTRHYLDNPHQYNNAYDNIFDSILVYMWKSFVHRSRIHHKPESYYKLSLKKLLPHTELLADKLLQVTLKEDYYLTPKDLPSKPIKQKPYTEQELDYYDTLD